MDIELTRLDYTVVGLTNSNCLELIEGNFPKDSRKVAVADADGILQVFSIGKDDIHIDFKTLPGPPITSVKVSGATGTPLDKIFIAFGTEVRGYTKKGKQFLMFQSSLTEPIKAMYVLGNDLFLCGQHIYTHYRDCKELGSYICGDKIIDVIAFNPHNSKRLLSLIACEGRMLRTIEHARVTSSIEIESSPTVLHVHEEQDSKVLLFGTVDGRIGILDVENIQTFEKWLISNENQTSITCIDSYNFDGNATKHLILGRQDGDIEIYQVNLQDELDKPKLVFKYNCNETVTSLKCGIVSSSGYVEIIVTTYTGRIFGLTTQSIDGDIQSSSDSAGFANISQLLTKLKTDIEDLKSKIAKEREKYESSTMSYLHEVSTNPLLSVKSSFILNKEQSTYNLSMELSTAIDNILLQCNTKIGIIEAAKNSAAVSYSDSNENEGNCQLVTYRCQINTNGLELKIRTTEGENGKILAYITSLLQPKCCRFLSFDIKPLSLHYRLYQFNEDRPFNTLSMKGTFSLGEIHFWLTQCLPEVPDKLQVNENTYLWFKSSLLATVLQCKYQKGEVEIKSDNVTTISILKSYLTSEATKKRNKIDINTVVNDDSVNYVINLQEDRIRSYQESNQKSLLAKAVQELEINEEEIDEFLPTKYKNMTNNTSADEFQKHDELQRLYSALTNLYIDYYKLKGMNVTQKAAKLAQHLENFNSDDIIAFFKPDQIIKTV